MEQMRKLQIQMQQEAVGALLEKMEEAKNKTKTGLQSDRSKLAIAKALMPYHEALAKELALFKKEQIKRIVRRNIRENEALFREIFGVDYKNLDDPLGNPLTESILANREAIYWNAKARIPQKAKEKLQDSKQTFLQMPDAKLEERMQEAYDYFAQELAFDGTLYEALALDKEAYKKYLSNDAQRIALALLPLKDGEIASAVLTQLLSLLYKSRADDEATEADRQDVAKEIGEWIYGRVGWLRLTRLKKLEGETLYKKFEEWKHSGSWHLALIHAVGHEMLDLVSIELEASGLGMISIAQKEGEKSEMTQVTLKKEFLESLKKVDKKALSQFSLTYKPMVVPPVDWEGLRGGGFLQDEGVDNRFRFTLIKASNRKDEEVLRGREIPKPVLDAVNTLQKVSYRINKTLLRVVESYYDKLKYINKKNRVDYDYYLILQRILTEKLYALNLPDIYQIIQKSEKRFQRKGVITEKAKKRIDKALKAIKKAQETGRLDAFALDTQIYYDIAKYGNGFDTIVSIAREMIGYERIYFVWQMDFRGRIYPKQTLLHPQGGDIAKALLEFADGKRLDDRGAFWLKIHGANVFGEVDKRPFDERITWVEAYEEEILQSATNPMETLFWKEADDPFKFLAFCFEYASWRKDPEHFQSHLPVAIDGSNNGFQHVATLLRDAEGARRVNVLPRYDEKGKMVVSDIYADVAEQLTKRLKQEAERFEEELATNPQAFEQKGALYYKKERVEQLVSASFAQEICDAIDAIPEEKIRTGRSIVKLIKLDLGKEVKEWIKQKEKKVRKEEEDAVEAAFILADRIASEGRSAQRKAKKGVWIKKEDRIYQEVYKTKLVDVSFFRSLLDNEVVDRSFVKKPVMTESYGSGTEGKAKGVKETLEKKGLLHQLSWQERNDIAKKLAELIEISLDEISPSASAYNDWIKKRLISAKVPLKKEEEDICAKQEGCIKHKKNPTRAEARQGYTHRCEIFCIPEWTTPLGLKVVQSEWKSKEYKLSVAKDKKVTIRLYTDKPDFEEHKKGLPPNYIHSLDATHLVMAINRLEKEGITHIATAHDSFAVHAADVDRLSMILRETFVSLHKEPLLEKLQQEFSEKLGYEIAKPPYQGNKESFPFEEMLRSEYMFA